MKRRILFSLIFILVLFVVAELISRAYYYRKPAQSPFATYELLRSLKHSIFPKTIKIDNTNHYTVRPQLSKAENDSIAAEMRRANYFIYYPWVEFSYGNIRGKYVNAHDRMRLSVPDVSANSSDPIKIMF